MTEKEVSDLTVSTEALFTLFENAKKEAEIHAPQQKHSGNYLDFTPGTQAHRDFIEGSDNFGE